MSDEFTKVATQEILEDINKIDSILNSCHGDEDLYSNAKNIQDCFHKIKGLAPMMGKNQVGDISTLFDSLMKQIMDGKKFDGIYDSLIQTIPELKNAMTISDYDLQPLEIKLSSKFH